MWGVWDSRRRDWARKPELERETAIRECRQLNDDWAFGWEDSPGGQDMSRAPGTQGVEATPDDKGGSQDTNASPSETGRTDSRPRPSRSRLAEMLVKGLFDDFERFGKAAIKKMRDERPHEYLKLIMALARGESTGGGGPTIAALGRILDRS